MHGGRVRSSQRKRSKMHGGRVWRRSQSRGTGVRCMVAGLRRRSQSRGRGVRFMVVWLGEGHKAEEQE